MSKKKITSFRGLHQFLSNFYRCEILYEGRLYRSVEHAFQGAKCVNDSDKEKIRLTPTPAAAKRLGRRIQMKANWDEERNDAMEQLLRIKFENPALRKNLIETGDYQLIEENKWHDTYWGVCVCKKHKSDGQNHLGNLLMKIRDDLIKVDH